MNNKDVLRILRCSAADLVEFAVGLANLTHKEKMAIDLCGRKGYTQEEAAEQAGFSPDAVQKWYRSGMTKLKDAWQDRWWIKKILQ